jgi:RNA polymerase sigma-70 factor (ECF subfamily)
MADSVITRPSLLVRIRDPRDRTSWAEFVDVYAPLVYRFARKQGMQDADAADLTQEVLYAVSTSIGKLEYDPERGSFRGWLFTVVRTRLCNFLNRLRRQRRIGAGPTGQDVLEAQPNRGEDQDALWEREYEARLFACASERVREEIQFSTWQAFWLTAIEGQSGKEAAKKLGLSTAAVYLAKRRVTARLRDAIQRLQSE